MKKCPYCAESIQSAAIKCKHCGSNLPPDFEATKYQESNASNSKTRNAGRHALGIIITAVAMAWAVRQCNGALDAPVPVVQKQIVSSPEVLGPAIEHPSSTSLPSPPPEENLPETERLLIVALESAQRKSQSAPNDMQRGGIKRTRDMAVCDLMPKLQIKDWIGEIKELNANSDGKGVLEVQLGPDIVVKTFNNAFSDGLTDHKTLIDPNSELFRVVSALSTGDRVRFSGTFFRSATDGECIEEGSLTLRGKLESPELLFRFSDVVPAGVARMGPQKKISGISTMRGNATGSEVNFDIDKVCKKISAAVGGSYAIEQGCVANEEESKQTLSTMSIPDRIMKLCINVAKNSQQGYQILYGCVVNELESKESLMLKAKKDESAR